MKDTDLIIEVVGKGGLLPPFSAKECVQTLTPISQGNLRRTVNGELKCLSGRGHQKFHSLIRCRDKMPPAFDGIWEGSILKIACLQYLTQPVSYGSLYVQPEKDFCEAHLIDMSGKEWPLEPPKNNWFSIGQGFPGGFMTYRPILMMMVKSYSLETDEWGQSVGWSLELEEV